ncbi:hypothetical protein F5887DRAFT_967371 [Amanita rubescens]|nr:hypothetical protein F5887DRAFT_967371 [Amanita rubescens]
MLSSSVRPTPSDPQLPKEIIDDIIDYLADDIAALRAFALTGRTFLHRARMHIFSCITLEGRIACLERGISPGAKFLALMQDAPYLAGYVKEMRVLNMNRDGVAGADDWIVTDWKLAMAIDTFLAEIESGLQVGTVSNATAGYGGPGRVVGVPPAPSLRRVVLEHLQWNSLPSHTKIRLGDLMACPTLKDVTLKHIRAIPWTVCDRFPVGLDTLWLFAVEFYPAVIEDSVTDDGWTSSDEDEDANGNGGDKLKTVPSSARPKEYFPRIGTLVIHRGSLGRDPTIICTENTLFAVVISSLRVFVTSAWSEREWRHNQEILATIVPTGLLESFGMGFFWRHDAPLPVYVLGPTCPKLHTIHILTHSDCHPLALQAAFVWLYDSLQNLPLNNHLERITIQCCVGPRECSNLDQAPPLLGLSADSHGQPSGEDDEESQEVTRVRKNLGWAEIDKTFATSARFSSLRRIHLKLSINEGTTTGRYGMLVDALYVILPRLMESDMITYERKKPHWPPERFEF